MKALIISNRASGWENKIRCYRTLMPFLSKIIIVAPPSIIAQVPGQKDEFVCFIDETKFIQPHNPEQYNLDGFEHASFNFILRSNIICSNRAPDLLGNDFLVMDDDNIPLEIISTETFFSNNTYTGYYYQRFKHILPEKFQLRSYDISLRKTRDMLESKGMTDGFVFSSHMPQLINRNIFMEALNFFNPGLYDYLICDWSMYFNYAVKFHSQYFRQQPAPVICWPMNRGMAARSLLAENRCFENYYPENYKQAGLFYTLPRYATPTNNGLVGNQKKIIAFEKKYPCKNSFSSLLSRMAITLLNTLLTKKLIKLFYVIWKEDRQRQGLLKRIAIYYKFMHDSSYIQAMRSRRWPHSRGDVQVVGLFDYPSGLGTSARYICDTLHQAGGNNVKQVNVSGYFTYPGVQSKKRESIASTKGGTVIFMLGPPQARRILYAQDFARIQHKKLINYVWFESNPPPADWIHSLRYFDEIWVNNSYIKNLLAPSCTQLSIPIKIRPFIPKFSPPADRRKIFSPDKVSILMVFNINSGWYRKNPEAVIQAYAMLPQNVAKHAELIIKTHGDPSHRHYKRLQKAAEHYGFTVITDNFSDQEISGLLQGCDIYASLHRAEGLALLPLQAMSYGKAVLATGWSGNMSYMTKNSNILVNYTLQTTNKNIRQYIPDMVVSDKLVFSRQVEYAEPDIQHASILLARLIMDADLRTRKGQNAKKEYLNYIDAVKKQYRP